MIDFSARKLTHHGSDVTLTAREWAVLDVLAASFGRVVSREDVIAAAWPRPGQGAGESLDVIVSRLRRKLGEDGGAKLRTVPLPDAAPGDIDHGADDTGFFDQDI